MNKRLLYAKCRVTVVAGTCVFLSDRTLYYSFKHYMFRPEVDHPQVFQYVSLKNKV